MADQIVVATSSGDYEIFGDLIREYWGWLQARYADLPGFIDAIGGHQGLEAELSTLAENYGPPAGKVLLARRDAQVVGGVAYRRLDEGACEMKRLFVPERFQGRGTGRLLCQAVIDAATTDGYRAMRLDTGYHNGEALVMYASLGFRPGQPYHRYPAELMAHLRFLEKSLTDPAST